MMLRFCQKALALAVTLVGLFSFVPRAFANEVISLRGGDIRIPRVMGVRPHFPRHAKSVLVQMDAPISKSEWRTLERGGVRRIASYFKDAYWVYSERGFSAFNLIRSRVQGITPFQASWKAEPSLLEAPTMGRRQFLKLQIVGWASPLAWDQALRNRAGVRVVARDNHVFWIDARPSDVVTYLADDSVEWMEQAPALETMVASLNKEVDDLPGVRTPITGYETGARLTETEAAWERGFRGQGQVVAMADTGLDTGDSRRLHPDFRTFRSGHALGMGSESWSDAQGHGTHVAGSIVGTGWTESGAMRSGAYEAEFVATSLWSPIMDNLFFPRNMSTILSAAYHDGARIHSNSWGNPRNLGEYDSMAAGVDEFVWKNPDFLVLFAAGNSGADENQDGRVDEGSVSSPGTAKNILTVGASENLIAEGGIQKSLKDLRGGDKKWGAEPLASDRLSDNADGIAAFSSRGPTRDQRLKPEIVAPGTNILSTRSWKEGAGTLWGAWNEFYAWAGGTSMATPIVAGIATLVRQYAIQELGFQSPSAAFLKAVLMHTAVDLFPGQYGWDEHTRELNPRPNVHQGFGRVNARRATDLTSRSVLVNESAAVAHGEVWEYRWRGAPRQWEKLEATLVYTDAPASPSAGRTLVNDLDLELVIDGVVISNPSSVNNHEFIRVEARTASEVRVRVRGTHVVEGRGGTHRVPFALIVTP